MRGHIRRHGTGWQAIVSTRDPLTGKRRQITKSAPTKRDAEAALTRLLAARTEETEAPADLTMATLLVAYREHNADRWAPSTARMTRQRIANLVEPNVGEWRVAGIRPHHLDELYRRMRQSGGHNGRPLAHATVLRVHNDITGALGLAWRWGWVRENVALRAQLPPGRHREVMPPEPADVVRVIAAAHATDPDWGMWLHLAAVTGARRSEVYGLRWSDIDLAAAQVTIQRAIVFADGPDGREVLVAKGTKTGKARTLSLDVETVRYLRAHRARAAERALACGAPLPADAYLFPAEPDGRAPSNPGRATRRLRRFALALGVEGLHPHALRHFMVSELLAAGVDLSTVAGRAGHSGGGRTTLAVYAHLRQHADERAADVIAGMLSAAEERAHG